MEPGAIAGQFVWTSVLSQALRFALFHNAPDFPAASIVFNANAYVSEPFPVHKGETLVRELAGLVENELGFGETDDFFSVIIHGGFVLMVRKWGR
jgi:hypothetical protein